MKECTFFGEEGLTSTSANHVANMAKEYYREAEAKLLNVRFHRETVQLIGGEEVTLHEGWDNNDLMEIPKLLADIAQAKSLIAWLREAIKKKQDMHDGITGISDEEFSEISGMEIPESPHMDHVLTEEEYYESLPIKTRNRYFALQTEAAVIGQFIHNSGAMHIAMEKLNKAFTDPVTVDGKGRDALIYKFHPCVEPQSVKEMFFALQQKHRSIQAQINSMENDCDEKIKESEVAALEKYRKDSAAYEGALMAFKTAKSLYIKKETEAVKKLKIVIPNELKVIHRKITTLGK